MKNFILGIGMLMLLSVCGIGHATTEWNAQDYDLYSGDFNGDGKTDILYVAKDPSMPSGIALSNGTGPNIAWQSWASNFLGINWSGNAYNVIVADFNGDGKADILLQSKTPGNSYLLLTSSTGLVVGISQTIANGAMGLTWSADQHHIVAGDFNGDHKADLFLQATNAAGTDAVVLADANGMFTSASPAQTWTDGYLGFKWSTNSANVFAGNFNGNATGLAGLLIQAKPIFVTINYDVPFPVPTYPPNMNGFVAAQTTSPIFTAVGAQAWSRMNNGVDWSPLTNSVVVGVNGTGQAIVILQARYTGKTSHELIGNASGAIFPSTATSLSSNVNLSADTYHLIAANFAGGGGVGLYYQALTSAGTNYVSDAVGTTIVASVQSLPSPTTVIQPATAAGRSDGQFAVSPTGGATYNIPIETPPGVGSVQLKLGLNYDSRSPNGVLGMGWAITGLSAITRCNKTYAQDGVPGPITLQLSSTYSDRFCLDGQQLKLTSSSANYGYGGSTYATEIESFSLIQASTAMVGNGPASFTVTTKNGLVYTYGGTSDSEVLAGTSGTIRAWSVSKIADRVGNTISLSYQQSDGSYRIDHILYPTTSTGQGPFYEVLFQYGTRPTNDIPSGYIAGYSVSETNQLNSIATLEYPSGSLIKQYNIAYTQSATTNRNTLTAVQECSSLTCLTATTIRYQSGATGWSPTINTTVAAAPSLSLSATYAVDINGDGITDLLYATIPSGTSVPHYWVLLGSSTGFSGAPIDTKVTTQAQILPGDFNGDGTVGFLYSASGVWNWAHYNKTENNFTLTPTNASYSATNTIIVADANGDGLPDLLWTVAGQVPAQLMFLRNITTPGGNVSFGSSAAVAWTAPAGVFINVEDAWDPRTAIRAADFNGDGRADLVLPLTYGCCTKNNWSQVLVSSGSSASNPTYVSGPQLGVYSWQLPYTPPLPIITDWNGDGCTDILVPDGSTTTGHWEVLLSTCAGTFAPALDTGIPWLSKNIAGIQVPTPVISVDWDGDGRADLLGQVYSNGTEADYLTRSMGEGAATAVPVTAVFGSTSFIGDFDGDGQPDIASIEFNSQTENYFVQYVLHNGASSPPDLALSFTDGFGMNDSPTFVPLTNASYYSKDTGAVFPEVDYQGPTYVVNQFTASDGTGSTYQNQFYYDGARLNGQGRGFEGFNFQRSYDSRNALYTYSYLQRPFPYTGIPYQRIVSNGTHYIEEWTATPNSQTLTGLGGYQSRWFRYLSPEVTTIWETSGPKDGAQIEQSTKTTAYGDGYGNPTQIVVSTTDQDATSPMSPFDGLSWTRTVNASYYNDTLHNCLGLPDTRTVQSAVPGQTTQTRNYGYLADTTNCRTTRKVIEPSTAALTVTTVMGFDRCGNTSSVSVTGSNPDGTPMATRTTSYNYSYLTSRCQKPEQITNALGQFSTIAYNYDFGVPKSTTDPNGLVRSWVQDDYGRNTRETKPDGTYATTVLSSCSQGPCWGVTDLRFESLTTDYGSDNSFVNQHNLYYDGFNRLREDESYRANGLGNATVWNIDAIHTYDSLGRQRQLTKPFSSSSNGYMQWSYDVLNRQTSARLYQPNGTLDRTTATLYLGRTVQVTDPRSNITQRVTDVTDRLRRVIDPAPGGTTQYSYDAFGNLDQTIDAIGATSSATFNLRGFRTQMVEPDAGTWNFSGDSLNETVAWTDAKSQSFSAIFDLLGRMTSRTEPEGTSTWIWGSTAGLYNIGQLASVAGYGYTENLSYDNVARLSSRSITTDQVYTYNYAYNAIGKLSTIGYPASPAPTGTTGTNFTLQYAYVAGEPVQIEDVTNSAAIQLWASNSQTDAGLPATETMGTGTAAVAVTTGYKVWTDEIQSIQSGTGGSTTNLQNLGYTWDTTGNLTQRGDANQVGTCAVNGGSSKLCEVFTPDALNRLFLSTLNGVSNLSVGYDASGNITTRSDVGNYTYPLPTAPHPHAATAAGSNSYTFDLNGNVGTKNGLTFTWASYNLPTYLQSTVSGATLTSQFLYGPEHQRYQQVASFTDGTETTRYVGDALEKMTASLTGLTYWRHYITTPSGHHIVVSRNSDGSTSKSFVLSDQIGSSDTVVNGLTGALSIQESFSAFGLRRQSNWTAGVPSYWSQTAITDGTRHGFTSHEELDGVGLIHMNGRVYDPTIGRFMSVDPVVGAAGNSQAHNPYSYVENRPLVLTDPTGFCAGDGSDSNSCPLKNPSPSERNLMNWSLPNSFGELGVFSATSRPSDMVFATAATGQQSVAAPPAAASNAAAAVVGITEVLPALPGTTAPAVGMLGEVVVTASRISLPVTTTASAAVILSFGGASAIGNIAFPQFVRPDMRRPQVVRAVTSESSSGNGTAGDDEAEQNPSVAGSTSTPATPPDDDENKRGISGKGWRGDRSWRDAVKQVSQGGTHEEIGGSVPTREEGVSLLRDARARIDRIEGPHSPPNPHDYPHINYTTESGVRGTMRIGSL